MSLENCTGINEDHSETDINTRFMYTVRCLVRCAGMNAFYSVMVLRTPFRNASYSTVVKNMSSVVSTVANVSVQKIINV